MENERQEEHWGQEKKSLGWMQVSTVQFMSAGTVRRCLWLMFTECLGPAWMLSNVQSNIVCKEVKKNKKGAEVTLYVAVFFGAKGPNDHNLSSCLFNYPPRPDWVAQSLRIGWRRWNKNSRIPWEGCPLNPAANAAPAAPVGHYCCWRGGEGWHSKTRPPPPPKSWSTGHVRRALGQVLLCDASN